MFPVGRGVGSLVHAAARFAALVPGTPIPAPAAVAWVAVGDGAGAVDADYARHTIADDAVAVARFLGQPVKLACAALSFLTQGAVRALVPAPAAVVVVSLGIDAGEEGAAVCKAIRTDTGAIGAQSTFVALVPALAAVELVICK